MEMKGSVIIVTGASQGIGREIAHALAKESAMVVFAARSIDKLRLEASKAGSNAIAVQMDVSNDQSIEKAIREIMDRYGRIDAVINNAGFNGSLSLWSDTNSSQTRQIFDTHVYGTERVMRAIVPIMRKQKSGVIVNFASIVAWVPMPGAAAYSAAKAAIVSLSETLREELREFGIAVRVFSPAHTNTGFALERPTRATPQSVAQDFVEFLHGEQACATTEGLLLFMKRIFPRMTANIMNQTGFKALAAERARAEKCRK